MRKLFAHGVSSDFIAKMFRASRNQAWALCAGKSWRHLPNEFAGKAFKQVTSHMSQGVLNPRCKLTEEDVRTIRREFVPRTKSYRVLAERYGLTYAAVYHIVQRKLWPHLD